MTITTAPNILTTIEERLKSVQYSNPDILKEIFKNCGIVIERLKDYIKLIDPEEIGESSYGTILFNFEIEDESILLDVGKTTMAYVYSDGNKFSSDSAKINDSTYWDNLIEKFKLMYQNKI